jgi:hypothetical protein
MSHTQPCPELISDSERTYQTVIDRPTIGIGFLSSNVLMTVSNAHNPSSSQNAAGFIEIRLSLQKSAMYYNGDKYF